VKVSAYIAVSHDGFIAREDGAIDWLPPPQEGEDYGYAAFMDSVDAIVMGRKTYETARGFGSPERCRRWLRRRGRCCDSSPRAAFATCTWTAAARSGGSWTRIFWTRSS
jgi:dihydrofolate reductase